MITAARPINEGPAHYYWPDGRACWSVPNKSKPGEFRNTTVRDARSLGLLVSPTTVCKLLHRHALVEWMIESAVLACVTTPKAVDETLDQYIHRVINVDRVQDEERNLAAQKGKEIHRAIQNLCASIPISEELYRFAYPAWKALAQIGRVVATERTIVGDGYAGMTDCILENDSEVWIVDFKSTRNIPDKPYDESKLQVSSYCGGLGNTGNKRIRGMLVYISTTTPGEIKVVEVENWQKDFERFKLLLRFFVLTNGL